MLKEEVQLLQEPGSYVGEVVKVMGKSKVLVKVSDSIVISMTLVKFDLIFRILVLYVILILKRL